MSLGDLPELPSKPSLTTKINVSPDITEHNSKPSWSPGTIGDNHGEDIDEKQKLHNLNDDGAELGLPVLRSSSYLIATGDHLETDHQQKEDGLGTGQALLNITNRILTSEDNEEELSHPAGVSITPLVAAAVSPKADKQKREECDSGLSYSPVKSRPESYVEYAGSKYCRGQVTIIGSPVDYSPSPPLCKAKLSHRTSDLNLCESMAQLPITRAIRRGEHSLVLESLRQGENPSVVCPNSGKTYLHLIGYHATQEEELSWVPMVYQLSNAGADVDALDHDGTTAALIAIRRRLVEVLAALLKCGAELRREEIDEAELVRGVIRADMLETVRRFTPTYWEAVLDPTSFKVSRLVKAWCRINIARGGQTLVEFAKQNACDPETIRLLVQNEVSIELAHAVMAGDTNLMRVLLCNGGADLSTTDCSVRSVAQNAFVPLCLNDAAYKFGHMEAQRLLRDAAGSGHRSSLTKFQKRAFDSADMLHGGYATSGLQRKGSSYGSSSAIGVNQRNGSGPATSALCLIL